MSVFSSVGGACPTLTPLGVRQKKSWQSLLRSEKDVTAKINNLRQRGRLTDLQAQQIHAQLASLTAPAADERTIAIRIRQVRALAQLRQTGALSETEFQAEKARILTATPDQ